MSEKIISVCDACFEPIRYGTGGAGTCEGLFTHIDLCSDCASYTLDELGLDEDATSEDYVEAVRDA